VKTERAPRTIHAARTEKDIEAIVAQGAGRYFVGEGNLYLNVSKGGTTSWTFFYRFGGKQREMGLGSTRYVKFGRARDLAIEANYKLRCEKADPNFKPVAALTLQALLEEVIADRRATWKANNGEGKQSNSEQVWRNSFKKHAAKLMTMTVDVITLDDVLAVLRPIWGKATGFNLQERLEKVLGVAVTRGMAKQNVARWKGHLEHSGLTKKDKAAKANRKSLPAEQVEGLMLQLAADADRLIDRLLTFTILTAVRADEAREAVWSEFNLDKAEWTIPAERMKAKKEYVVPLSKQAVALLKALPRRPGVDFVFINTDTGSIWAKNTALGRLCDEGKEGGLGYAGKATVHGFRSTFSTWANAETTFDAALIDASIAHARGKTEGAYNRGALLKKRAALMQVWANLCYGEKAEIVTLQLRAA
jgi:integrase